MADAHPRQALIGERGGRPAPGLREIWQASAESGGVMRKCKRRHMNVPEDLRELSMAFYPGSGTERDVATIEEWVDSVVQDSFNRASKRSIKACLDELLDGTHGDAELERLWNSTAPSYKFGGERAVRCFLTLIRDRL